MGLTRAAAARRLRLGFAAPKGAAPAAPGEAASGAADDSEFHFVVVRDLAGLDGVKQAWDRLADRSAAPQQGFQAFAWMRSWAVHYADEGHELHVVLGYRRGELALIWPLAARKRLGLRVLEFLGEPLCQYHDVLIERGADAGALLASALRHLKRAPYDLLALRRVRADTKLATLLIEAGATVDRRETAPFIDFAGVRDFEEFERTLPSKARASRRRRMRRIRELGKIAFETCESPAHADELVKTAMAFKRTWALKSGHYAPAAFDPRFERCFQDAARPSEPNASLRVFAMLCDGRPIGVEISYGYKGRLFAHVLAPDPAYAKHGLGNALADAAIRAAFAQGYQVYDLLAPADPYKAAWTKSGVEMMDFTLTASRRGALLHWLAFGPGRRLARAAVKRAPPALARFLLRRMQRRAGA
ncbi:MAG: GNAT family N-acetyltransferase [Roseiarcus sp.]|jgi:CelD/BcsL family acetyltransferase involved in cellulose biosynthesis